MKNEFAPGRAYNNYFLKMVISIVAGSAKWTKIMFRVFGKAEQKTPYFAEAVSDALVEFFSEMGYPANRKKKV